jgi:multiple sugar transport system permease protein
MPELSGWQKLLHRLFIVVIVAVVALPLYWLVLMSVTPQVHLAGTRTPTMVPIDASLDAYSRLVNPEARAGSRFSPAASFRRSMLNSTVVSLVSTILALVIGTLAAYSMARLRPPAGRIWFMLILGSYMIAPITLAVPLFTVFRNLGVLDTYVPLIVMYTAFGLGWSTLIMRNYFSLLPSELEDAARIDGCSRLGSLVRVVLPIATPGLVSVGIVTFLLSWGEFLYALLFTNSNAARTMPIVVTMFVGEFGVEYNMIAAALVLGIIPPVVVALLFQRYIVAGLTAGSVKG